MSSSCFVHLTLRPGLEPFLGLPWPPMCPLSLPCPLHRNLLFALFLCMTQSFSEETDQVHLSLLCPENLAQAWLITVSSYGPNEWRIRRKGGQEPRSSQGEQRRTFLLFPDYTRPKHPPEWPPPSLPKPPKVIIPVLKHLQSPHSGRLQHIQVHAQPNLTTQSTLPASALPGLQGSSAPPTPHTFLHLKPLHLLSSLPARLLLTLLSPIDASVPTLRTLPVAGTFPNSPQGFPSLDSIKHQCSNCCEEFCRCISSPKSVDLN